MFSKHIARNVNPRIRNAVNTCDVVRTDNKQIMTRPFLQKTNISVICLYVRCSLDLNFKYYFFRNQIMDALIRACHSNISVGCMIMRRTLTFNGDLDLGYMDLKVERDIPSDGNALMCKVSLSFL